MQSGLFSLRYLGQFAAAGFILVAAGCQSSDTAGVLGLGGNSADATPKITDAELRAFCPRVQLREGTAYYNTYTKDGKDDPLKVVYQASIGDVTRSCSYGPGTMTVNVAVAGRVVPGPQAKAGTITMPIRVVAMRGDEVLYSQLHQFPVAIGDGVGATQFVFSDPAVSFPTPSDAKVIVYAGYDEGPADKKKKTTD
jgi:hypothetical protein